MFFGGIYFHEMGETCCRRLYRDSEGPWAKKSRDVRFAKSNLVGIGNVRKRLEFGKCRNWHPALSFSFFATAAFVGRALLCSMQNTHLQREEGELGPRIRYLVPFLFFPCCVCSDSNATNHQHRMSVACQNFFPHFY